MKLLIVENDGVTLDTLAYLLRGRGHAVETAANAEAALTRLAVHVPDAMVLDLVMPGMDGFDLLRHMHGDERLRGVPVVITTGLAGQGPVMGEGWARVEVLVKPFGPEELEAALEKVTTP